MKLFPWQARFRRGIARPGVRLAALAVARSNGKSYLVADLAKDYLLGDRHDSECLLVASEFKQSKIILRYLFSMLRADGHKLDDRGPVDPPRFDEQWNDPGPENGHHGEGHEWEAIWTVRSGLRSLSPR